MHCYGMQTYTCTANKNNNGSFRVQKLVLHLLRHTSIGHIQIKVFFWRRRDMYIYTHHSLRQATICFVSYKTPQPEMVNKDKKIFRNLDIKVNQQHNPICRDDHIKKLFYVNLQHLCHHHYHHHHYHVCDLSVVVVVRRMKMEGELDRVHHRHHNWDPEIF